MEENGLKHVTFSTADGVLEAAPAVDGIFNGTPLTNAGCINEVDFGSDSSIQSTALWFEVLMVKSLCFRYGAKTEELTALREWSCPRCRGICNCSIRM